MINYQLKIPYLTILASTSLVCYNFTCLNSNTNLITCPVYKLSYLFKIDLPTSNCCSHRTFFHLSLQSSHLNICYYHHSDSHPTLLHKLSHPSTRYS
ncbi:hypothetical protein BCR32DRAFT_280182 [Anaeromyces robustus]|uniref:Uncharacterized protein n=1 Tax=Anaeromyces robustus TaxID=1754192 RepID=A0A1Y1X5F0_9FUNG|nr:hypothetical protein BCR32DRAFT_280182 [Anaeromyces robustus]|eukprot:ORX80878.1 hypothetical protein BCR32DRAFT_280182 [Anaeromyces robustus]